MRFILNCFFLVILLSAQSGIAERIETPMMESRWDFMGSKAECRTTHRIPDFGTAGFILEAGSPLVFYLHAQRLRPPIIKASLTDRRSPWTHEHTTDRLFIAPIEKLTKLSGNLALAVTGSSAEHMFQALALGRFPTFSYIRTGKGSPQHGIQVPVSSVNFVPAYEDFGKCRRELLAFGINEIQDKILYFDYQSNKPTHQTTTLFNKIRQYMDAIKGGSVLIGSEAASIRSMAGKKWFNARFTSLKTQLINAGVKRSSIKKQTRLPTDISKTDVRIHLFGSEGLRTYYFSSKKTPLTKKNKSRLELLARYFLDNFGSGKLILSGHTDGIGSKPANKQLGMKRAMELKAYLEEKGVNGEQIVVRSYGETRPLFSNRSREGRAKNRRVVVNVAS